MGKLRSIIYLLVAISASAGAATPKAEGCHRNLARFNKKIVHRDPYRWLEQPSKERTTWMEAQRVQTQNYFAKIPQLTDHWKAVLFAHYNKPEVIKTVKLKGEFSIKLTDKGLNQPNEVAVFEGDQHVRTLFSSYDVSKDGSVGVTTFSLDPTRKFAIIPSVRSGSLDVADLHIIDIETGKAMEVLEDITDYGVTWISAKEFIYNRYFNTDIVEFVHTIGTNANTDRRSMESARHFNSGDASVVAKFENDKTTFRFLNSFPSEDTVDLKISSILKVTPEAIFVKTEGEDHWEDIVRISLQGTPTGGIRLGAYQRVDSQRGTYGSIFHSKGMVFIELFLGVKRWGVLLDKMGELVRTIHLPSSGTVTGFKVLSKTKIEFVLRSQIVKKQKFLYDIKASKFESTSAAMDKKLLTDSDGQKFVNTFVTVKSKDGKELPVRIVYKEGLKLNGDNSALVLGYGGFNIEGYLTPHYSFELKTFLSDGGVYVAPALRGGSELGPDWHKAATFKDGKKQNTFDDMIATLKMLTKEGYSSPSRIGIEGWSNGGYLIGAMITQAPHLFKLGIPGNGVQDQLRKQILDPRFDGWEGEWGNPDTDEKAFVALSKISPVNLATKSKKYPTVLGIVGENDSRVNSAHTYKLIGALQRSQRAKNPILMLAVDRSGHWVTSEDLQDIRAYRTLWKKWATIYNELGMEVPADKKK